MSKKKNTQKLIAHLGGKTYKCYVCKDTGKCQNCGGDCCMDCRYTGDCQACNPA